MAMQPSRDVGEPELMRFEGWSVVQQSLAEGYDARKVEWSPDGRRLLVYGRRGSGASAFESLVSLDVEAGTARRVHEHPAGSPRPAPHFGWLSDRTVWTNRNWGL